MNALVLLGFWGELGHFFVTTNQGTEHSSPQAASRSSGEELKRATGTVVLIPLAHSYVTCNEHIHLISQNMHFQPTVNLGFFILLSILKMLKIVKKIKDVLGRVLS